MGSKDVWIKTVNKGLKRFGLQLRKVTPKGRIIRGQVHDPSGSYMVSPNQRAKLNRELARICQAVFSRQVSVADISSVDFEQEIAGFFSCYCRRPFHGNQGGSGFHNAFWLYLFARILQPELIVESGVFKGQTTWLFTRACPASLIHGFDIDLTRLEFEDDRVRFHESDWKTYRFTEKVKGSSMVFFDCHVNHAARIMEAYEKGFRHLVFDDNPPVHRLYAYGRPGLPTADMVYHGGGDGLSSCAWYWQGRKMDTSFCTRQMDEARRLIRAYHVFPDVGGFTRYGGFSNLTYVGLKA